MRDDSSKPYDLAVLGIGRIGLPLATYAATQGLTVIGADIDPAAVTAANLGDPLVRNEPELQPLLQAAIAAKRFQATTEIGEAIGSARVVILVPPIVLDGEGGTNFGPLDAMMDDVCTHLQAPTLLVLESTVPVGTTRQRVYRRLVEAGFRQGDDFLLGYSPERVSSGTVFAQLREYPKVVGAFGEADATAMRNVYGEQLAFSLLELPSAESAEFTKLIETTYRDVNIGLANEFALLAESLGVDVMAAIEAANSQPFSHIHRPGVGVGGHCIPVYPHFLFESAPAERTQVIRAARTRNAQMPAEVLAHVEQVLGTLQGKSVVIVGAAYRRGVHELRYSNTEDLVQLLEAKGANASVWDPTFTPEELAARGYTAWQDSDAADCVLIQSGIDGIDSLDWEQTFPNVALIVDGRRALTHAPTLAPSSSFAAIGSPWPQAGD